MEEIKHFWEYQEEISNWYREVEINHAYEHNINYIMNEYKAGKITLRQLCELCEFNMDCYHALEK